MIRQLTVAVGLALSLGCGSSPAGHVVTPPREYVVAPPQELVAALQLSPLYVKYVDAGGVPVFGSAKVSDYAVLEASYLIRAFAGSRPEILRAIAKSRVRFVVMAPSEMTTDIPEHADLVPKAYWDRRARGLGATADRPAVSCGEENLLGLPGDPYAAENILVHEFAHVVHERGMSTVDPTFDARLTAAYESAKAKGLWAGTYAMENRMEYWAEATQSWFDCNRANDREHGPIDTRPQVKVYDPTIASLLTEVFGDGAWRYVKPSQRPAGERAHLRSFDVATAGRFDWPSRAPVLGTAEPKLPWLAPADIPQATTRGASRATSITFFNARGADVTIDWLDFDGKPATYATVRPHATYVQSTFAGHVWLLTEHGTRLGAVIAADAPSRAEIH